MVIEYINAKNAVEEYAKKYLPITVQRGKVFRKYPKYGTERKESLLFWLHCIYSHYCLRMMNIPRNKVLVAHLLHRNPETIQGYLHNYTMLYYNNKIFKYIADDIINKI